ncbi:hypothetical protein Bca101_000901 [Brassica carinata]
MMKVVEGDITQLVIQFQDELGNVVEGNTPVVLMELPKRYREKLMVFDLSLPISSNECERGDKVLRQGYVFNIEAGKQALTNIKPLRLFSNIEVNPRPDKKNEGAIVVEIILKEFEHKSVDVSTVWNIVHGLVEELPHWYLV